MYSLNYASKVNAHQSFQIIHERIKRQLSFALESNLDLRLIDSAYGYSHFFF